jgi:hypothetical protein
VILPGHERAPVFELTLRICWKKTCKAPFFAGASLLAMQPVQVHSPSLAGKLPQCSPSLAGKLPQRQNWPDAKVQPSL